MSRASLTVSYPLFDTQRAYGHLKKIALGCPARVTGSPGARCAADFVENSFRSLGLPTRTQSFPVLIRGERVTGRNVFAVIRGTSSVPLLVVAHYDAPVTSPEAAADNGSGVATLLELARIFLQVKPKRTLILLASDAGVWGSIGTDVFARDAAWTSLPGDGDIPPYAAISLDHVTPGHGAGMTMRGGGHRGEFAPLWLRARVAAGVNAIGTRVFPEGPFSQLIARAIPLSFTGQGPLQKRGIAAINLSMQPADAARARAVAYTEADTLAGIRPGALRLFGTSAEAAVSAVLGAGIISSPDLVTLSADKIVMRSAIRIVAGLLFLPLGILVADTFLRRRPTTGSLLRAASWTLPVGLGALAMRLAVRTHLLPGFSAYPAALRDPFLTTWQPLPMLGALLAAGLGVWAARRISAGAGRREAGLFLLLVAGAWAWLVNDLSAAMLLAPAAWAWPWLGALPSRRGRALDAFLLALGLAPFLILLAAAGSRLFLGPWIPWYGALLLGYGVVTLQAAVIAGLAVSSALALLAREPPEGLTGIG